MLATLGARVPVLFAVQLCLGLAILASACLLGAPAALWLIFAYALAQGTAAGTMSILKPLLTAETLGRQDFGAMAGAIAMAPMLAGAVAPTFGAALIAQAGESGLIMTTMAIAALGLGATFALGARLRRVN
ncbi:MAG: hypothetical protein R3D84_07665 [Paracoccaceae bacterium]